MVDVGGDVGMRSIEYCIVYYCIACEGLWKTEP